MRGAGESPTFSAFCAADALPPLRPDATGLVGEVVSALRTAAERAPISRIARFRRAHPGARFSDYYVERVTRNLERRQHHKTLGPRQWSAEKLRGQERYLELLRDGGLKPHHRCVEYGCGSLRIGRHLIRFLDPGGYLGLDVSDRFFAGALDPLDGELVREKQPELYVKDADLMAELEQSPPDFVVSIAVLHHVHPTELDEYLGSILRLLGPDTQALVSFREWRTRIRTAEKSWSHPARELVARIGRIDSAARVRVQRARRRGTPWDPSWKSLLWISRQIGAP